MFFLILWICYGNSFAIIISGTIDFRIVIICSHRLQVPSENVNYAVNYTIPSEADQPPVTTATEAVSTNIPAQTFQGSIYTQPSAPPMSPSYAPLSAPNLTSEYIPQYESLMTEELDPAGVGLDYFGGGTRYTYQTTPSVNKLQIEPSPPTTPRPVGPVMRAKSAPGNLIFFSNGPLLKVNPK